MEPSRLPDRSLSARFLDAIRDYEMFRPEDRVILAISGGKDSFTMMDLVLRLRRAHFPGTRFTICQIQTDITCSGSIPRRAIRARALEAGLDYHVIFFPLADKTRNRVDCFYCALRRRTALIKLAFQEGCNRIAFGHHLDDIVETMLMNMVHHSNISTMPPRVDLFDGKLAIVRPLAYVVEEQTRAHAESLIPLPPKTRCPGLDESVRRDTKEFIARVARLVPEVRRNLFAALGDPHAAFHSASDAVESSDREGADGQEE